MVNSSCLGWIKILIFCPSLMFWTELWPSGEPLELPWRLHQSGKVGPSGWDRFGFSWSNPEDWFFWIRSVWLQLPPPSQRQHVGDVPAHRVKDAQVADLSEPSEPPPVGTSTRRAPPAVGTPRPPGFHAFPFRLVLKSRSHIAELAAADASLLECSSFPEGRSGVLGSARSPFRRAQASGSIRAPPLLQVNAAFILSSLRSADRARKSVIPRRKQRRS